jgi:predicted ArsR family transcriptional regulator
MLAVMDYPQVDLFGNPYDPGGRKQGRPEHKPTEESIINVMVLIASGQTNKEIANTLGLDVKTLRRHYDHLLKQRSVMFDRLKSKLRTEQIRLGLAGNAAALSNAIKMLDAVGAERAARTLKDRAANQSTAKGYVSKKEQSLQAAQAVGGKYAVRPPPRLVANGGQVVGEESGEG